MVDARHLHADLELGESREARLAAGDEEDRACTLDAFGRHLANDTEAAFGRHDAEARVDDPQRIAETARRDRSQARHGQLAAGARPVTVHSPALRGKRGGSAVTRASLPRVAWRSMAPT